MHNLTFLQLYIHNGKDIAQCLIQTMQPSQYKVTIKDSQLWIVLTD